MKKAVFIATILFISVISTACINNFAVKELNTKAQEYMKKGDYENAISRLKASIDLDNSIFETHYNLAIAYTNSENYENAINEFKNAIDIKPDFADSYYSLGVAQENYAKGLLAGDFAKKDANDESDIINDNDIPVSKKSENSNNDEPPLTEEDRQMAIDAYHAAIEAYETYLSKAPEASDRAEVERKINYLSLEIKNAMALIIKPAKTEAE